MHADGDGLRAYSDARTRCFRRSYLKANKVSKIKRTMKVEYAYHFRKCADAAYRKLSKLVHAC